jgi:hypothetical protein
MKLLPEFALIQDIFEGSPREVRLVIGLLREKLLNEGLVRDLHGGVWSKALDRLAQSAQSPEVRKMIGGLYVYLRKQKRLVRREEYASVVPRDPLAWCHEALADHRADPVEAIIAGNDTASKCKEPVVRSIDEVLDRGDEFRPARSLRVLQQLNDQARCLHGVLTHARWVALIDPYLDPEHRDYSHIPQLLKSARNARKDLQLHREAKYGPTRESRVITKENDWRQIFGKWDAEFRREGLSVQVFIWGDFHNRYLVSNLASLKLGKGFGVSRDPKAFDHWARLDSNTCEGLEREFCENSPDHEKVCSFTIGQ